MIPFNHRRQLKSWRLQPLQAATATAAPPTGLLVNDTFTGTDGTVLSAHTPDLAPSGSAWTSSTFLKLTSNRVQCIGSNYGVGLINSNAYNVRITFACINSSSGNTAVYESGILARQANGLNWRITFNTYNKLFRIWEYDGSSYIARASISIPTLAAGTLYTLVAVVQGTTISATLDGANDISYASASANARVTSHGLFLFKTNTDYGDDFSIEGL